MVKADKFRECAVWWGWVTTVDKMKKKKGRKKKVNLHHPEARLATAVICRMWERRQRGVWPAVPRRCHPEHSLPQLLASLPWESTAPTLPLTSRQGGSQDDVNWSTTCFWAHKTEGIALSGLYYYTDGATEGTGSTWPSEWLFLK